MKKNKLLLTALAVILAMGVMVAPALAYFTAHTEAAGGIALDLGHQTTIDEEFYDWGKIISVNNEGPESCYVRVQAFSSERLEVKASGAWTDGGDGWWYYNDIVDAGESTTPLDVAISDKSEKELVDGQIVDVAIVYESMKVVYDENGKPDPADPTDASIWTTKGNPAYEGSGE
ncbi:MAG: hypothetical protein II482_00525 [Lachnospiraceae bacterium]|nr:hypothetical protein [Lachnospiraceae bacterium]